MASRAVSTDPIWLGIGSPKPQPRVKQNSMFGHVVDAFDEKTIVKIGEISPYERRMKAKEDAEKRSKESLEIGTVAEDVAKEIPLNSASDGPGGEKQDGESTNETNGKDDECESKREAVREDGDCQTGIAATKHLEFSVGT